MATGKPAASRTKLDSKSNPHGEARSYSLMYQGKRSEREILDGPKASPKLVDTVGKESNNRLYFGDNASLLRHLASDEEVKGKVRLIYIDPPYATGSEFETRALEYAYKDVSIGAEYLEFLRERLILLRELLAEDGSIYVHLDSKMALATKVIMDEVFGASNFRNWITRVKSNRKNYTRKQYGNIADYILFYTKGRSYVWNRAFEEWDEATMRREYQYVEENTGRRYKKVPVHAPGTRKGATGGLWKGMLPPPGKHWQYTPDKLDEMDARGEIYWSPNGNPRRKIYFDDSLGIPVQDVWTDYRDAHNQNIRITGYPTEKPPALLERIISASSNEGDLVLDCFVGSGTATAVAEKLGRKWVGIDKSPMAIEMSIKRLTQGTDRMGDFVQARQKVEAETLFDEHLLRESERIKPNLTGFRLFADPGMLAEAERSGLVARWRRFL
jgi:adenine-specific DNA-methyltransferase